MAASFIGNAQVDSSSVLKKGSPKYKNYQDRTSLGCIIGWHQWKYGFGEVGFGIARSEWMRHGVLFHAASISLELNPQNKVYGYKLSIWKSIPFVPISVGINGVHYRKLNHVDWTVRPMIGVGMEHLHLTYSYDFQFGVRDIIDRNTHMFSIRYFIPIVTLKTSE